MEDPPPGTTTKANNLILIAREAAATQDVFTFDARQNWCTSKTSPTIFNLTGHTGGMNAWLWNISTDIFDARQNPVWPPLKYLSFIPPGKKLSKATFAVELFSFLASELLHDTPFLRKRHFCWFGQLKFLCPTFAEPPGPKSHLQGGRGLSSQLNFLSPTLTPHFKVQLVLLSLSSISGGGGRGVLSWPKFSILFACRDCKTHADLLRCLRV